MRMRLHPFLHDLPPGPSSFPHLNLELARQMRDNPLGTLMGYYDEFGPVFTLRFLGLEMVFVIGPEANQKILVRNRHDFSWGEGFLGELVPFIGRGLLTTDDLEHDRARKLLAPAFYPARIRSYGEKMVERAARASEQLRPGQHFEMHEWARNLAIKIAGDVLLGMKMPRERARFFAERFEKGLSFYGRSYIETLVIRGPGTPFRQMKEHVDRLDQAIYEEIAKRRAKPVDEESILDTLIAAEHDGDQFTDREVRDQLLTLLFAGHDTTAATIAWLFTLVCKHRPVYRKLQEEIDSTLDGRDATADELIDGFPYLDQVVKETLRLYPAAWFGPRKTRKEFKIYGHTIPAQTHIAYSSWLTHRLPHLWSDPDAFDPERFTDERYRQLQPGAYVPFGRGPRTCIGMRFGLLEVKAVAVALLRRYRLELFPGQSFQPRTVPTISPRHGVRLVVRSR